MFREPARRKSALRQQPDSPLTGVLLGGAAGSVPGIYSLVADPNECPGLCTEDDAAIAVGAIVGSLIDRAIHGKVTVYEAGERSSRARRPGRAAADALPARGVEVSLRS
jgi:hypothetical protein